MRIFAGITRQVEVVIILKFIIYYHGSFKSVSFKSSFWVAL